MLTDKKMQYQSTRNFILQNAFSNFVVIVQKTNIHIRKIRYFNPCIFMDFEIKFNVV